MASTKTQDAVKYTAQVIKVTKGTSLAGKVRPGSLRAKRWQILQTMDGKTVSDYYAACRKAGIPCTANNPRDAVKKDIITLTAPKS